jgi:hypothetical protein
MQLSETNLQAFNRANNPFANMVPNVLVIGAGELGLAVLEALAAHPKRSGVRLSVLLRQATLDTAAPEKRRKITHLQSLNVHFEAADVELATAEDLAPILGKYHTVVSCTGMELPSGTQTKLARAALRGGVKRYFPWQFGMDYDLIGEGSSQDLFDEQLEVRKILRAQSEVDWVIVSTGLFMSFLFLTAFGIVDLKQRTVRALGSWDNKITVTTPRDIGRVTAEVVLDPRQVQRQVAFVAGDTVTYAQVGDILDAHYGGGEEEEPFKRELWDLDTLRRQLAEEPDSVLVKYRETFAHGVGVAWDMEGTVNHARAMEMTDVKRYLRDVVGRK